jgi:subfamily B ATP-binding cassette protein MsbA
MLLRFLRYIRPYAPHLAVSVTATLVYVFLAAILIWMIGPLVNTLFGASGGAWEAVSSGSEATGYLEGIKKFVKTSLDRLVHRDDPYSTLVQLCWVIIVISLIKNVFLYIHNFIVAWVQQKVIFRLRNELFSHYHDLSLSYFDRTNTGKVISRVTNDVSLLTDMLDLGFTRLVKDPLTVLVLFFSLFVISWQLTLLALLVLPATWLVIFFIGRAIRRYSGRSQEKMAEVATILEESISGIRVVKAFAMKDFETARFRRGTQAFFREMLKMTRLRILNSPINEFFGTAAGVAILYVGGRQVLGGISLTADEFMTYFFLMFSMLTPVKALAGMHVKMQEGAAAVERIFRVLDTKPSIIDLPGARPVERFTGKIVFDNVSFAYRAGHPVLQGINLELPRGKMIALVGPSGGGKSTLCDILARFYDPPVGRILVDGVDLREFRIDSWRRLLGIVTQETILFNDTVAHNIAYGMENCPREKLIAAAEAAYALEFIEQMSERFDTVIGPRGVQLSGGQRQRLAIARAIMKDPEILVFDEATSALDTESEAMVQKAINNLVQNRTTLVVAHRLSTIRRADEIVVIDAGKIVQRGSHEKLLAGGGLYKKLHDLQFKMDASEAGLSTLLK